MRTLSDFLFARPSVLYGLARFLDFGANFDSYNDRRTPDEADAVALYADWRMVGEDIFVAYREGVKGKVGS